MITIESILNEREIRNQLIERDEVLEKVKRLMLMPNMNTVTVTQIADFYDVTVDTINKLYKRHAREIDMDGVKSVSVKDILEWTKLSPLNSHKRGSTGIDLGNGTMIVLNNRGVKCFPKRAVLRIGMLLRDSDVAKEVRTQLLNTIENAEKKTPGISVLEIETEEQYNQCALNALKSHDFNTLLQTMLAREAYVERHMNALQAENKVLIEDTLNWDNRKILNRIIRLYGSKVGNKYQLAWNAFYKELQYRYGIQLSGRDPRGKYLLDRLNDDEYGKALKVAVCMCKDRNLDLQDAFNTFTRNKIESLISQAPEFDL